MDIRQITVMISTRECSPRQDHTVTDAKINTGKPVALTGKPVRMSRAWSPRSVRSKPAVAHSSPLCTLASTNNQELKLVTKSIFSFSTKSKLN